MEKARKKVIKNPKTGRTKTVGYGQKGKTPAPGTKKGQSYCARSAGIKKGLSPAKQRDPNSPNNLSRKRWGCTGDKSKKK